HLDTLSLHDALPILIGVNDLGRRYKPDAVVKNIFDIISEIREVLPDTEIILQSVYPVNEKWGKAYFKRVAPGVIEVNNALSAGEDRKSTRLNSSHVS